MLELIDLDIDRLNYSKFISSWLYPGKEGTFLIDPGPACTIPALFDELNHRNVDHLDWILLTHIHMDHAGGIGHVIERFPDARVACHKKAVAHLINPKRLWEGSLKVLGDVAGVYGEIKPVPAENIVSEGDVLFGSGIKVISTPGHAAHHQCFVFKDWLFCGELFGIFHQLKNTIYLRPATPPKFVFEDFIASMDKITPYMKRQICFSHYGAYPDGEKILKTAKRQLALWVAVVKNHVHDPDVAAVIEDLTHSDPVYALKKQLAPKLLQREMHFSENSVRGILQYLKKRQ
jgi:glyoxylase-like metal-dependent hydrolase (beta-lactamase superfamily II)